MEIDANQLSEDEWEYYYAAKDIILNLQEYLEKHCSPEEVQITNFYRTHIIDGHFNLETNKSTKRHLSYLMALILQILRKKLLI